MNYEYIESQKNDRYINENKMQDWYITIRKIEKLVDK